MTDSQLIWDRCGMQVRAERSERSWFLLEPCPAGIMNIDLVNLMDNHCSTCQIGKKVKKNPPKVKKTPPKTKKPIGKPKSGFKAPWKSPPVTIHQFKDGVICPEDAVGLLKSLKDESIDLAIFDPAYQSLEKHRNIGSKARLCHSDGSSNDWFPIFPNTAYWPLFEQLYRVMKKGTFIFMMCDQETRDIVVHGRHPDAQSISEKEFGPLIESGFKFWKNIIWNKEICGMGYHFRAQHEFIILAEKVVRKNKHAKIRESTVGDVLSFKRLKGPQFYPTEKPIDLVKTLVTCGSDKGNVVLDMFAGSGVTGKACVQLGRKFILGDLKTDQAVKALKNEYSDNT